MAEERNLSHTQTCRDSCDMFDGAFSSIPCESDDWNCLESDDDFDCWERQKQNLPCPAPQRTICPNSGLSVGFLLLATTHFDSQILLITNRITLCHI